MFGCQAGVRTLRVGRAGCGGMGQRWRNRTCYWLCLKAELVGRKAHAPWKDMMNGERKLFYIPDPVISF